MRNRVFLELEGIANADLLRVKMMHAQILIVVSTTSTDTVTMLVKDDTGNDDQIDRTIPGLRLRFRNTHATFTHHILSVIGTDLHRVTMGDRE